MPPNYANDVDSNKVEYQICRGMIGQKSDRFAHANIIHFKNDDFLFLESF